MLKEDTIMKKTLRYLLMTIAILGVLSVNAQTHQYVTTHYSGHEQATYTVQVNPQMPTATMGYTHSDYMTSGSTLPQAAVDGATTTYDEDNGSGPRKGGPRKGLGGGGGPGDRPEPYEDPIGDAAIPLALLALAYLIVRVMRKRMRA